MHMTADALLLKPISIAFFFHFALSLFAKIAFNAVEITRGKLAFRKIENMQL